MERDQVEESKKKMEREQAEREEEEETSREDKGDKLLSLTSTFRNTSVRRMFWSFNLKQPMLWSQLHRGLKRGREEEREERE